MKKILLLSLLLTGCEYYGTVLPSDIKHAEDACSNHGGWVFFKKDDAYTEKTLDHDSAPVHVTCSDGNIFFVYPKNPRIDN